ISVRLRSNPPEAAGNRHKSAHRKKTLAKDGDLGENRFAKTLNSPASADMHDPPLRWVLLFLGYVFLQTRRLISHDSANRCHELPDAATRLAFTSNVLDIS
ncbi:MAG TPA: hypothetical protein PLX84_14820, partial [Acidiphilium sp.]|nr:hypothetical protein [Acidiphilium sp.]